jgi:hypothetical protein
MDFTDPGIDAWLAPPLSAAREFDKRGREWLPAVPDPGDFFSGQPVNSLVWGTDRPNDRLPYPPGWRNWDKP